MENLTKIQTHWQFYIVLAGSIPLKAKDRGERLNWGRRQTGGLWVPDLENQPFDAPRRVMMRTMSTPQPSKALLF